MRSVPAIAFDYRPSRLLAAALVVMTALAVAAIAFCRLAAELKFSLTAIALICSFAALRGLLSPKWTHISWSDAGWVLSDRSGTECPATVVGLTQLRSMLVLRLCAGQHPFNCLLLPDNSDSQLRRRLVLLMHRHATYSDTWAGH
jgi:toxin CptA